MAHCVQVTSALALGWIPYHKHLDDMPKNNYHLYASDRWKRFACDLLFYSGNDSPPREIFRRPESFTEYLKSKDYRGALLLSDIKMYCHDDGRLTISCNHIHPDTSVGYTPWRPLPIRARWAPIHTKGDGETVGPNCRHVGDGALLSFEVAFRVCKFANRGNSWVTGYWLPFVWMRVGYYIRRDGSVTVALSGGFIPNQVHYHLGPGEESAEVYNHDMEGNSPAQINSVLATRAQKAVDRHDHVYDGKGWMC